MKKSKKIAFFSRLITGISDPGHLHRNIIYGIADSRLLAVIDADKIPALVLDRQSFTLGSGDIDEFYQGNDALVGPGLLHCIPDRSDRPESGIIIHIEHKEIRGDRAGPGRSDPDRVVLTRTDNLRQALSGY